MKNTECFSRNTSCSLKLDNQHCIFPDRIGTDFISNVRSLMGAVCWTALLTLGQKGMILKSRWIATWSGALACSDDESREKTVGPHS